MGMGLSASGALSGAATGAAIGSAVPGIGTAIGAIGGGIIGLFSGSSDNSAENMEKAWEYEKEGMGLQYMYNNQMAQQNQKRAKEMWDYTNFENQRAHLERAGLSVGLMYGNGGSMQASTAGGQGQGTQGMKMNPIEAALQAKAIGIQMQQVQSQTALNVAQANKANAEAQKTKGVDTEAAQVGIEKMIAETKTEAERSKLVKAQGWTEVAKAEVLESTADLNRAKTESTKWEVRNYQKSIEKMTQEIISAKMDNSYKAQAMEDLIKQASLTTAQMFKNLTKTEGEVNKIAAEIQKMGLDVALTAEKNEIDWKNLEQVYEQMLINLDIKEQEVDVAYKSLIVEALKGVAQAALGATAVKNSLGGRNVIKGFTK